MSMRLDVWLDVACLFRTRSEAQKACRNGKVDVLSAGHVDKGYNFWSRNPVRVSSAYLGSDGATDAPAREIDLSADATSCVR